MEIEWFDCSIKIFQTIPHLLHEAEISDIIENRSVVLIDEDDYLFSGFFGNFWNI